MQIFVSFYQYTLSLICMITKKGLLHRTGYPMIMIQMYNSILDIEKPVEYTMTYIINTIFLNKF